MFYYRNLETEEITVFEADNLVDGLNDFFQMEICYDMNDTSSPETNTDNKLYGTKIDDKIKVFKKIRNVGILWSSDQIIEVGIAGTAKFLNLNLNTSIENIDLDQWKFVEQLSKFTEILNKTDVYTGLKPSDLKK